MERYCFGVDVGGTAVKVGLFNEEGNLLKKWDFPTQKTKEGKNILKDVSHFIHDKILEEKLEQASIIGIGIGLPGPVRQDGEVLELPNLGLGHFNIEKELRELSGFDVKAGNDANVAALGEYWQGSGKGYSSMVLITLGTGVGGGIIVNGSIVAGSNGAAGEIGHIYVDNAKRFYCGCGKQGCLEQYASATGIVRLALAKLTATKVPSTLRELGEISAKNVFDYAKKGDALALEIVDEACGFLGLALAHVAQVLDPDVFVIGGGVSKAGRIIIDTVSKHYVDKVMDALKKKEFQLATLGNDAGIYGGAKLILDYKK